MFTGINFSIASFFKVSQMYYTAFSPITVYIQRPPIDTRNCGLYRTLCILLSPKIYAYPKCSPFSLKEALQSFSLAFLNCQPHYSYGLGSLLSKIRDTWTQALWHRQQLIWKLRWLLIGRKPIRDDSCPGWGRAGQHEISSGYSKWHVNLNLLVFISGIFYLLVLDQLTTGKWNHGKQNSG